MPLTPPQDAPAENPPTSDPRPIDPTKNTPPQNPSHQGPAALLALFLVVTFVTTADLLLSRGAKSVRADDAHGIFSTLGLAAMASPYTLAGIVFHLAGLAAWLFALRHLPLTIAYCFTALNQATIALGAWLWLGELISPLRWVGIGAIMIGVLLLVPSIVKSEQRTDSPPGVEGAA